MSEVPPHTWKTPASQNILRDHVPQGNGAAEFSLNTMRIDDRGRDLTSTHFCDQTAMTNYLRSDDDESRGAGYIHSAGRGIHL